MRPLGQRGPNRSPSSGGRCWVQAGEWSPCGPRGAPSTLAPCLTAVEPRSLAETGRPPALIEPLRFNPVREGRVMGLQPGCRPAFLRGSGRGNKCPVYPLAGWISCLALESRGGGQGWLVRFPLHTQPPPRPAPQLPDHPSVHGSPVKPKAGNRSAIPLQNQDLSEHDRPAGLL